MLSEEGRGSHIRKRGRVWPKGNEDGDMGEKGINSIFTFLISLNVISS